MNEAEWLSCDNPQEMLRLLRHLGAPRSPASRRKLRLFGCACVRRHWRRASDRRSRALVEAAEHHADGLAGNRELAAAERAARAARHEGKALVVVGREARVPPYCWAYAELSDSRSPQPAWEFALLTTLLPRMVQRTAAVGREDLAQAALLRDLFGNPFRPVSLEPAWLTPSVTHVALATYDERILPSGALDSLRLKVLADALEEAGCTNPDLLDHLRGPGPHVRGCWPVDLLLGKS